EAEEAEGAKLDARRGPGLAFDRGEPAVHAQRKPAPQQVGLGSGAGTEGVPVHDDRGAAPQREVAEAGGGGAGGEGGSEREREGGETAHGPPSTRRGGSGKRFRHDRGAPDAALASLRRRRMPGIVAPRNV